MHISFPRAVLVGPCWSLWVFVVLVDPCRRSLWILAGAQEPFRDINGRARNREEWGLTPAMAEALWDRPRQKRLR